MGTVPFARGSCVRHDGAREAADRLDRLGHHRDAERIRTVLRGYAAQRGLIVTQREEIARLRARIEQQSRRRPAPASTATSGD